MSRRSTKSQASVEKLLDERQQYQRWLAKLADGTSAVPQQVLERVREDYGTRLEKVTKELARYEKDLETALAEAEVRCEDLLAQRAKRAETLAEAELRHQVGEFDDERFTSESAEQQAALAQLGEEIAAAERDRAKFEEVLDLIAGALPGAPPPAAATPAPAPGPPEAPAAPSPPPPPEPEAALAPTREKGLDELAFLRSVTAAAQGSAAEPPAKVPAAEPPEPVQEKPVRPPEPAVPEAAEPKVAPPAAEPEPPAAKRAAAKEARPPRTTGEADDTPKSLRCTECGTFNRPTEWYCEKCGAELSAF